MITTNELELINNIKPWYSLTGVFDEDSTGDSYWFVTSPTVLENGKYTGTVCVYGVEDRTIGYYSGIQIDFTNEKIYKGETELIPGSVSIQLINMLNGEIIEQWDF